MFQFSVVSETSLLSQHTRSRLQIGVITPYEGQRAFVVSLMARVGPLKQQLYKDIEVGEVSLCLGVSYFERWSDKADGSGSNS